MNPAAALVVLIITGSSDLPHHHWDQTTPILREWFNARVLEEPDRLRPSALEGVHAVIVNYHGPRWGPEAEKALEDYVRKGGALLAFHQSSYGPFFGMEQVNGKWRSGPSEGWTNWSRMIGAHWDPEKIGHARRTRFQVEWRDGTPAFEADDELYHRLSLHPTARVLADGLSPKDLGGTGEREPLIWTHTFGQGRVWFTVLGHDPRAFLQPGMREAFTRGLRWAARQE
jgi:type 1 glutamine amidotransferase